MVENQIHFGRKFYLDKKKGYWYSTDSPRIFAHRWVWINHNGPIPNGCHIHHIDENKSNNSIENLQMMSISAHLSLHGRKPSHIEYARKLIERIRPLTIVWHKSEEGRAWHKFHAIKNNFGKWEAKTYQCEQCSKEFQSTKRSGAKFCTNACKSKWRRAQGFDNIEKICVTCSKSFISNKYSKVINCSRSCAATYRWNQM